MKATNLLPCILVVSLSILMVSACSKDAAQKESVEDLENQIESLELKLKATEAQLSNVRIELADCMEKHSSPKQLEKNE